VGPSNKSPTSSESVRGWVSSDSKTPDGGVHMGESGQQNAPPRLGCSGVQSA
jgi:hypothetical protein